MPLSRYKQMGAKQVKGQDKNNLFCGLEESRCSSALKYLVDGTAEIQGI